VRQAEKIQEPVVDYDPTEGEGVLRGRVDASEIAAGLERVRQSKKDRVLFLCHNLGGGCERHIGELAESVRDDLQILTLRPAGNGHLNFHFGTRRQGTGMGFRMPNDYAALVSLCGYLGISRIHYHHLMGMHSCVQDLAFDLRLPYDVTLHDYYLINGNPTLTDERGCFVEDPESFDRKCAKVWPVPNGISAVAWRNRHAPFLHGAERVIAPSSCTARLHKIFYPHLEIIVAYHPDWERHTPYPPVCLEPLGPDEMLRIVVLGALNREKGADLLESAAQIAKSRNLRLRFELIGYAYRPLQKAVVVHGPYEEPGLKEIIKERNPHVIWFPSLCPETYSYALSAALEIGKPIAANEIGSFSERLANRPLTWLKSWKTSGDEWANSFDQWRRTVHKENKTVSVPWENQPETDWTYERNYRTARFRLPMGNQDFVPDREWIERRIFKNVITPKEQVLLWLMRIRFHPMMDRLARRIPYPIERRVRRWFSQRTVREMLQ
jgi:glycosyltransferase involved in cell wall biosynthesis